MIINPKYIFNERIITNAIEENIQQNGIDFRISENVILEPKSFANVMCYESVKLPRNMSAILIQRSSLSRQGVFLTSGLYDSGFEGIIGCSLYNMSDETIVIHIGDRIGQIVFMEADSAGLYSGKWQHHGTKQD